LKLPTVSKPVTKRNIVVLTLVSVYGTIGVGASAFRVWHHFSAPDWSDVAELVVLTPLTMWALLTLIGAIIVRRGKK
jgi:uncharacterized membrane protein